MPEHSQGVAIQYQVQAGYWRAAENGENSYLRSMTHLIPSSKIYCNYQLKDEAFLQNDRMEQHDNMYWKLLF